MALRYTLTIIGTTDDLDAVKAAAAGFAELLKEYGTASRARIQTQSNEVVQTRLADAAAAVAPLEALARAVAEKREQQAADAKAAEEAKAAQKAAREAADAELRERQRAEDEARAAEEAAEGEPKP